MHHHVDGFSTNAKVMFILSVCELCVSVSFCVYLTMCMIGIINYLFITFILSFCVCLTMCRIGIINLLFITFILSVGLHTTNSMFILCKPPTQAN